MIDQSPLPSRQLQLLARFARLSLSLVLVFWLLVATVWATLHGFIVPRIDMWRVEVERVATQALGAQVRIESVQGETDGLFPTIRLRNLSVLDEEGRVALQLPTVIATISARSVLRRGLEQLYIEAPVLDIRHLADGRWLIAGLEAVHSNDAESPAISWLLQQPELVIRQGHIRLTDEQRSHSTVQLHDVDLVMRNRHWSHVLRLEASPEKGDGERIQLVGAFRTPLLPSKAAPWKIWSGQWYASLYLHRMPQLPFASSWKVAAVEGNGQVRMWLDFQRGQPVGITADVALTHVRIRWHDTAQADFDVRQLRGRLSAHQNDETWKLQGQSFSFEHGDGSIWPHSNWTLQTHVIASKINSIKAKLDYADIGMTAKVIAGLPVSSGVKTPLSRWLPQGQVHDLELQWSSDGRYQAQGEVKNLALQPQPAEQGVGIPGVEGLELRFSLTHHSGKADLQLQDGVMHFPGVFEEPAVPLQRLQAQVQWSLDRGRIKVEVPKANFFNADARGRLHGWWQTGDTESQRLPGVLHLQGNLEEADGARVHRYLPLQVPETARHYVRDSVHQGLAKNVAFEVRGNLQEMPFSQAASGRFYIKVPLQDVSYAFAPAQLGLQDQTWPALNKLSGDLIFDGVSMSVQNAQSTFAGFPQLQMASITAQINDLRHPLVEVYAQSMVPLTPLLHFVRQSPLASYTSHALTESQARGNALVAFHLQLPLENPRLSKVQGKVGFQKSDFQFNTHTPWLRQLQGAVEFSEQGFLLNNVQGQALGGGIQFSGGMPSLRQGVHIQAHGTATAQGLQRDEGVPLFEKISAYAQGQTAFSVDIQAQGNKQTTTVHSDLRGMSLLMPEPLQKIADASWPLTVTQSNTSNGESTLHVEIPKRLQVIYAKNPAFPSAIHGHIAVGDNAEPPLPLTGFSPGVRARVQTDTLDVDAWLLALTDASSAALQAATSQSRAYLPQQVDINVEQLRFKGRNLHAVEAQFTEHSGTWHGQFQAQEFSGHAQYRTPAVFGDSGRIFARLAHLHIPKAEVQRLNEAEPEEAAQDVRALPALDIEVEQLQIADRSLGKLVLQARNTQGPFGRDWILEQFDLTTPEARWRANGAWAITARGTPRTTQLGFLLEIDSSGKLLERFGMHDVIRNGQGRLSGSIGWLASPISPDWKSMHGNVNMQVQQGQFLKAEPGMAKLLSVLSLQSLTHRINLDFRDVFSQGFAFDFIRGDISVENGVAQTNNLQMKGLNAAALMEGHADLVHETQNLQVVVVPEINAMTASLAATAINPVVGVGSFLAQMFLRSHLMEAATRTFRLQGTWADPIVTPIKNKAIPPSDTNKDGTLP